MIKIDNLSPECFARTGVRSQESGEIKIVTFAFSYSLFPILCFLTFECMTFNFPPLLPLPPLLRFLSSLSPVTCHLFPVTKNKFCDRQILRSCHFQISLLSWYYPYFNPAFFQQSGIICHFPTLTHTLSMTFF